MIYADNAATTPMSEKSIEAYTEAARHIYGNPSSVHSEGMYAKRLLEASRKTIADCIGAETDEIYFTSGGTESDNWALLGLVCGANGQKKKHIVSTAIEHHAILHTLGKMESAGYEVTLVEPEETGEVSAEKVRDAIQEDTCLVSVMYGNNETGVIQPVRKITEICGAHTTFPYFHTDAVQAVGHVPINVKKLGVDMLSASAHKFHGPKGAGFLYVKRGTPLTGILWGGGQEKNMRPGTENVPGIAAMAAALEECVMRMNSNSLQQYVARTRLEHRLLTEIEGAWINGSATANRLPGVLNMSFDGVEGEALLLMLDKMGICASAGSACTSGDLEPSHVLTAMGISRERANSAIRFSFDDRATQEDADEVAEAVKKCVEILRGFRQGT